ncbi:MAG: VanZ family protein, partial [Clostridia bacterium]|nr:VanZ family protein [Clostridia bacterium]
MLSAENAQQSSQTSAGLIEKVVDTFVPSYKEMPKVEQEKLVFSLQDVVRKAAHFTIYAALGF